MWVCIIMLSFSLIGLDLVQHHIQVIPKAGASDMQKVMRKVMNTLDVMNNRIVQVEVESLAIEWSIGIKHYENSGTNFLSLNPLLLVNSEHEWLKLSLYFPSLLVRQKWHTDKRNVEEGDICLVNDSNAYRGEWRLCVVTKAMEDGRNKVRNVQIVV